MKITSGQKLMDDIDKGIRAGAKKALLDYKKAGRSIVVRERAR